jgi:hypothetical protein
VYFVSILQRLEPIWQQLSEDPVAKENNVQIARLNADMYVRVTHL